MVFVLVLVTAAVAASIQAAQSCGRTGIGGAVVRAAAVVLFMLLMLLLLFFPVLR